MAKSTVPGVVQLRVIADPDQYETVSGILSEAFNESGMQVIQCSRPVQDRYEEDRVKFHVVAIPNQKVEQQ